MLTINCAADLIKITLSCSVSTSVGISAVGSYLHNTHGRWYNTGLCDNSTMFHLFISHVSTSDTNGKLGCLKFSIEMSLG